METVYYIVKNEGTLMKGEREKNRGRFKILNKRPRGQVDERTESQTPVSWMPLSLRNSKSSPLHL